MSEVSKKIAYLKGMAEGMELKEDTAQNKLLLRMLEALEEISEELEAIEARQDEAEQYIDELDSDLGDVEEILFGDEDDEDDCDCGCHHYDDEDDGLDDYDEDDEGEGVDFIEYECPHCKTSVYYDQEAFDLEEEHLCPECGKELFPTVDED